MTKRLTISNEDKTTVFEVSDAIAEWLSNAILNVNPSKFESFRELNDVDGMEADGIKIAIQ